jgi:hypothetical protein
VRFNGSSSSDVDGNFKFSFDEPLLIADTSRIRVSHLVDSVWVPIEYRFLQKPDRIREYELFAEWRPMEKYLVESDSAAFVGLTGAVSENYRQEMVFRSLDEYAVLYLNIRGIGDNAIVQMLNAQGKVVKATRSKGGQCAFYFISPGTYYLRLIVDENNNGKWDTGNFAEGVQPEKVFYYHHSLDLRALFEYSQDDWDITAPLNEQKPLEITKQKPDKERKKMNRNAERKFKK